MTNQRTCYVGGLSSEVDVQTIKSIFSSFGDIVDVNLPLDFKTSEHKGFAFVEFTNSDDASDAIDNMDNSEILGKTIRVSLANPNKINPARPVWLGEEYLKKYAREEPNTESEKIEYLE